MATILGFSWRRFAMTPAFAMLIVTILGFPVAAYLTLMNHSGVEAIRDAEKFSRVLSVFRQYFTTNVAARVLEGHERITLSEAYATTPGGIPIPATLSIEIGYAIGQAFPDESLTMSFASDAPFLNRDRLPLDPFQVRALEAFRADPRLDRFETLQAEPGGGTRGRVAVPVRMAPTCVACHNGHADSPRHDWQVGDVRGIQEVSVLVNAGVQAQDTIWFAMYVGAFLCCVVWSTWETRRTNGRLIRANDALEQSRRDLEANQAALEDNQRALGEKIIELRAMASVIERAPFGITYADPAAPDQPMIYANQAFVDLTGYPTAEALGRNCRYLQGPETDPAAVAAIREAIRDRRQAEVELLNYRKDGTRFWNRLQIFPVFGEDGALLYYVGTQTDVTRLKEAEAERQRLAGELLEVQRLQSLGVTIAGLAHDLNTPIGIALTAASQLSDTVKAAEGRLTAEAISPAEVASLVEDCVLAARLIGSNLGKAAKLVQSFKETTADATRTEWRKIELRQFLDTLLVSVSPIMRRARCIVTVTCPDGLGVVTEPGSLAQALSNLLVNATIHAFEGREDRRIALEVREAGAGVEITLRDNGCGMTDEAIAKAFTPFFTTRRHAGGSGLGLFSSRRLARDVLGGELSFESRANAGTSFTLRLPPAPRDHLADRELRGAAPSAEAGA